MEDYYSDSNNGITVVLDVHMTPELVEEGFVREIISKVQTMRKEAGFEVMDKIRVYVKNNEVVREIFEKHEQEISSEVLAAEVIYDETDGYEKEWNINSEKVTLAVKKV
jgi:isoleucyl-tRNA synthetase